MAQSDISQRDKGIWAFLKRFIHRVRSFFSRVWQGLSRFFQSLYQSVYEGIVSLFKRINIFQNLTVKAITAATDNASNTSYGAHQSHPKSSYSKTYKCLGLTEHDLDNPGGGDCLFYAFALELVKLIHLDPNVKSAVIKQWHQLDPHITEDSLTQYDHLSLGGISQNANARERLDELQQSLRNILAETRIQSVHAAIETQMLPQNPVYRWFAQLCSCSDSADYNPFGGSVLQENPVLIEIAQLSNDEKNARLQALFIQLFQLENSPIISILRDRANSHQWGTDDDLSALAALFNVNVNVQRFNRGEAEILPQEIRQALEERRRGQHTISLKNLDNLHWVGRKALDVLPESMPEQPIPVFST